MIDFQHFNLQNMDNQSSSESNLSVKNSSALSQQLIKQTKKLGQINAKIEKQIKFKEMLINLDPNNQMNLQFSGSKSQFQVIESMKSSSDMENINKDMNQIRQYFGKKQTFQNLAEWSKIQHNDTTLASFGKVTRPTWHKTPVIIINQKAQQNHFTRHNNFYQMQQQTLNNTKKWQQKKQEQLLRQMLWKQEARKQYQGNKQKRQCSRLQQIRQIRTDLLRQIQIQNQNKKNIQNQRGHSSISKRSIMQESICYNLAGRTKKNLKLQICMKALNQGKQKCSSLRQEISLIRNFRNIK